MQIWMRFIKIVIKICFPTRLKYILRKFVKDLSPPKGFLCLGGGGGGGGHNTITTFMKQIQFCILTGGASNEYPQHMFLWRTGKNYPRIITKYSFLRSPLLRHWSPGICYEILNIVISETWSSTPEPVRESLFYCYIFFELPYLLLIAYTSM